MDFHGICQKMDIDSIKAKFPSLPALPSMPHIKLPKSMPKIKSRKIFRTSKENVNSNASPKQHHEQPPTSSLPQSIPPSDFIKHPPMRISTISSLMYQESGGDDSTYRSANSLDDDYPLPSHYNRSFVGNIGPISPVKTTISTTGKNESNSNTQVRMSLSERLQRSYKDLSEFKIKNIFTKKTIVRKDNISIEHYVERYEEDLAQEAEEQERRDRAIAENYSFRFKISRQNTDHSNSITPDDSPRSEPIIRNVRSQMRSVGEHSGDESGMEITPPTRKPGIASTRFAKVRNPPLRFSSLEQTEPDDDIEDRNERFFSANRPQPIPSALWSSKLSHEGEISSHDNEKISPVIKRKSNYKERLRRLTSYKSGQEDSDKQETPSAETRGSNKMLSKLKSFTKKDDKPKRQQTPNSPQSSDDEQVQPIQQQQQQQQQMENSSSPTGRAITTIKQNFKRFHQSIKTRQQQQTTTDESGDEATTTTTQKETTKATTSKTEKFTARLRRFRSRDVSVDNLDEDENEMAKQSTNQSPLRQAFNNKFESLKKSIKLKSNKTVHDVPDDVQTSPENEKSIKPRRSDTLIKRLKHIRARKNPDSKEDFDGKTEDVEIEEDETTITSTKANKFTEARQRTFKKVNEKMQQLKLFHKSQEQIQQQQQQRQQIETQKNKPRKKSYHSEEEEWDESPEHDTQNNLPPTITRRDFPSDVKNYINSEENATNEMVSSEVRPFSIPTARAAWTTKSIFSESMESDTDTNEFPRVLIHQDNSDCFESTLIISVSRPIIGLPNSSPKITEIQETEDQEEQIELKAKPEKPPRPAQLSRKQLDWIPNKKIIADFLETTPPGGERRKRSLEMSIAPPPIPDHRHKRTRSMDSNSNSNSDSDTWITEYKRKENVAIRRSSQVALDKIDEKNEAWRVQMKTKEDSAKLYKTKSIDIFEKNFVKGGALTAFEDFDEELRNEPVLKIIETENVAHSEMENSDDTIDEENSSRLTKISLSRTNNEEIINPIIMLTKDTKPMKSLLQYGNSRESLIANFDENDEQEASDNEEEDNDNDDSDTDDRPPSAAPSPPPNMSPPPPPLPQRQSSLATRTTKNTEINETNLPPPLPKTKPPMVIRKAAPIHPPPRIPERSASTARAPKPLVKTSSLRVVYSEQVKPSDIGKVNKLISCFEPTEGKLRQRPRVIPRHIQQEDSEEYSDDDEDYATMVDKLKERYANIKIDRDTTPTPTNTPKIKTPEVIESPKKAFKREMIIPMVVTATDVDNNTQILMQQQVDNVDRTSTDVTLDINSNRSCSNSEYGSPLEYPSSLRSSLETIPIVDRKDIGRQQQHHQHHRVRRSVDRHSGRSRRSMTRDDDNFYSFDSDEENSYYSISSTGSNRYIVEL